MKLELQWVEFKNFYSFGNKFQRLDFTKGINLVLGLNKDTNQSNGAGKSSILETVVFGLFGETTKDVNKPQIVNWRNRKNCEVKVCFNKGNDSYVIHRGLKPNFIKVEKNGKELEQISHNKNFQSEIEETILGVDYATFISLIHFHNVSQSIFNVAKNQKRNFIEKLFGLEIFSDLVKKCNEKLLVINNKNVDNERILSFNKKTIDDLKNQNINFQNTISSLPNYKEKIKELKKELIECNDECKGSKHRITELKDKQNKIIKKIEKLNEELIENDKVKFSLSEKLESLNIKKIKYDNELFNKKVNEKIVLEDKIKKINVVDIESTIKDIDGLLSNFIDEKHEIELKMSEIMGQIQSLSKYTLDGNETECPLCTHKINSIDLISELTKRKNDLNHQHYLLQQPKMALLDKIEKAKKQKKDLQKELDEGNSLSILISNIDKEILELSYLKKEYENNEKFKDIKNDIENQLNSVSERKIIINNEIKKYEKMNIIVNDQLIELNKIFDKPKQIENEISLLKDKLLDQESQILSFTEHININKEKISNMKVENSKIKKDSDKLKSIMDYLEYIKKLCKDENVKQYSISNIVPYLNKQINGYLAEAGFGFYLKLDSWLNIEIKGPGINEAGFGNLSSGQQRTTNLATMLAFLDVCKLHSPIFPDILLFDEILDGSIDSITIQKLLNIIRKKQKEDGSKVFIVSHRKEINEIQFDNVYKIEFENGYSHLRKVAE